MNKFPILLLSLCLSSCTLAFSSSSLSSVFSSSQEKTSSSSSSSVPYRGKITLSGAKRLTVGEKETLEVSLPGALIHCREEGMVSIDKDVVTTLKSGTATLRASAEGYEDGVFELEIMPTLQEVRSFGNGASFEAKGCVRALANDGYLLADLSGEGGFLYVEEAKASYALGEEVLLSAQLKKNIAPSGMDLKAINVVSSSLAKKFASLSGEDTTLTGELFNAYSGERMERYLIRKATTSLSAGLLNFSLPFLSGSRRKASLHYQGAAPLEGTYDLVAYFTNVEENGLVEGFLLSQAEFVPSEPQSLRILSSDGQAFIAPGSTLQLTAIADPYDALQDVVWSIDEPSLYFSISASGLLAAEASAPLQSIVRVSATSLWKENPRTAFLDIPVNQKSTSLV